MRRTGWILAISAIASCGGARSDDSAKSATVTRCASLRQANEIDGAVLRRNEQRFVAARAAQQLTPVTLKMHTWQLPFGGLRLTTPTDVVEERDTVPASGQRLRVIMFGERVSNCYSGSPPEFVRNDTKIFRVARVPRVTKSTTVTLCSSGCTQHQQPFLCGGAQPPPEAVGYELPAATTYEGAIEVAFDAESVELRALATSTTPCPPQTFPP